MFHGYSAGGSEIMKVVRGVYTASKLFEELNCVSSVSINYHKVSDSQHVSNIIKKRLIMVRW